MLPLGSYTMIGRHYCPAIKIVIEQRSPRKDHHLICTICSRRLGHFLLNDWDVIPTPSFEPVHRGSGQRQQRLVSVELRVASAYFGRRFDETIS